MAATTVAVACGWTVWSVATVAAPATTVEQVVDWLDLPPNHGVRLLSHAIDVGTAATAWMVSERACALIGRAVDRRLPWVLTAATVANGLLELALGPDQEGTKGGYAYEQRSTS